MVRILEDIEKDVLAVDFKDKNEILKLLISDLDGETDKNVEKYWLEEVQIRYKELLSGKVKAISADKVMNAARQRLNK